MNENELKTIYKCRAGSQAYGTAIAGSDEDIRGIVVAPQACYTGCLHRFEQLERDEPDLVLYDIIKFCRLALECNPNIIEMLFVDASDILEINESGRLLRENRDLFLSKRARNTFLGYAFSQLKRIRTHRNWLLNPVDIRPERADFKLPPHALITCDNQEAFLWLVSTIIRDTLEEAKLSEATLAELKELSWHGVMQGQRVIPEKAWDQIRDMTGAAQSFIDAMQRERAYHSALKEYTSYQNWKKTRNPKRAVLEKKCGFDCKSGYHLVRLLQEGEELLMTGTLTVKRPNATELLEIRNGSWAFERIEAYASDMQDKMREWVRTSRLPADPSHDAVNALCQEIIRRERG
jgi:predicted nucleotidyltransferase